MPRGRVSDPWAGSPHVFLGPASLFLPECGDQTGQSGLMSGKGSVVRKMERSGGKSGADGVVFIMAKEIQEFCWKQERLAGGTLWV